MCSLYIIRGDTVYAVSWSDCLKINTFKINKNKRQSVREKIQFINHSFCLLTYNLRNIYLIRADAGYAISWSTLRRFVEEKFPDSNSCEEGGQYWKNGDWYLGKHLRELGIRPMDTRDHAGKARLG